MQHNLASTYYRYSYFLSLTLWFFGSININFCFHLLISISIENCLFTLNVQLIFSLNAKFGTVSVPNILLFHQSRAVVRFNSTEKSFTNLVSFVKNSTGKTLFVFFLLQSADKTLLWFPDQTPINFSIVFIDSTWLKIPSILTWMSLILYTVTEAVTEDYQSWREIL